MMGSHQPPGEEAGPPMMNGTQQRSMQLQPDQLQLVEAVYEGVSQSVERALEAHLPSRVAVSGTLQTLRAQLEAADAHRAELTAQMAWLQQQLVDAKEAAARVAGKEDALQDVAKLSMDKLDEERFARKQLQVQLEIANEELVSSQRENSLLLIKKERESKGRKILKEKPEAAPLRDIINRLEIVYGAFPVAGQQSKPLNEAEIKRLQEDLSMCATKGMVVPLVDLLKCDSSPGAQEAAARALAQHLRWVGSNGCTGTLEYIISSGAVPPLVRLLQSKDAAHSSSSATALAALDLLATGDNTAAACNAVVSEGAVGPLVELLGRDEIDVQRTTMDLLLKMCSVASKHCATIALAGGIEALLPLITTPGVASHPELGASACTLLHKLAMDNHSSKVALVEADASSLLVEILSRGPLEAHTAAASVLRSMAVVTEAHGKLLEAGVVFPLLKLLQHGDSQQSQHAAAGLAHLITAVTEKAVVEAPLVDYTDFVSAVLSALQSCSETSTIQSCALCLERLADGSPDGHLAVMAVDSAETLLQLLQLLVPRAVRFRQSLPEPKQSQESEEQILAAAAVAHTLSILAAKIDSDGPLPRWLRLAARPLVKLMEISHAPQAAELTAGAVGRLAVLEADELLGAGAVAALVAMLASPSSRPQKAAAMALADLERVASRSAESVERGGRSPTRRWPTSQVNLPNSKPSSLAPKPGVLPALLAVLSSADWGDSASVSAGKAAGDTLRLLLCNEEAATAGVETGMVDALLPLLNQSCPGPLATVAAKVLWQTLSFVPQDSVSLSAAVPCLVRLASETREDDMQLAAVRMLQELARFPGCGQAVASCNGIQALLALIEQEASDVHRHAACDALGALAGNPLANLAEQILDAEVVPVLVGLLQSDSAATKAAAAGVLGNLAYNNDGQAMVEAGAVPLLVQMLGESGECCFNAVHAVLNLSEGATREAILAAGAVEKLVSLLQGGAAELQLAAAMSLSNLVSSVATMDSIVAAGAVPLLIDKLTPEDSDNSWNIAQHAGWTLTKLASHETHKKTVMNCGGFNAAVSLVKEAAARVRAGPAAPDCQTWQIQVPAWSAGLHLLQSLAQAMPEVQATLIESGAAAKMVELLQQPIPGLQEAVAGVVLELADTSEMDESDPAAAEARCEVLLDLGVVPPLVDILSTETWGAEKDTAASALQHIARFEGGRAAISEVGGVHALVRVLQEGREAQQEAAILALEELAQDSRLAKAFMATNAIPLLISLLPGTHSNPTSLTIMDTASETLMHLAGCHDCRVAIDAFGGVPHLLDALESGSGSRCTISAGLTLQKLASDEEVGVVMCSEQVATQLNKLMFDTEMTGITQGICAMIVLHLTEVRDNHPALVKGGVVPPLLQILKGGAEEETAESAELAVVRLGLSEEGSLAITGGGGVQILADLLRSQSNSMRHNATQALCNIVENPQAFSIMQDLNVCSLLLDVLPSIDQLELDSSAAGDMLMSTSDTALRLLVGGNEEQLLEGVSKLSSLICDTERSQQFLQVAGGCLCELLLSNKKATDSVVTAGAIPALVAAASVALEDYKKTFDAVDPAGDIAGHMRTWLEGPASYSIVPRKAAEVLQLLSEHEDPECAAAVANGGGLAAVIDLVCVGDINEGEGIDWLGAITMMGKFAKEPEYRRIMMAAQATHAAVYMLEPLFERLQRGGKSEATEHILERASRILWLLSLDDVPGFLADFAGAGGILLMIKLFQMGKPVLKAIALQLLGLLVSNPQANHTESWVCVPVLLEGIQRETLDLRADAINVLRKIARDPQGSAEAVASGTLPILVDLLERDPDTQTQEAAARALGVIAKENALNVITEGGVQRLLKLLEHSDKDVRKEATLALLTLAELDKGRSTLAAERGIPQLVNQLKDTDMECRKCAAKVLHILAEQEEYRNDISEAGGVQAVVDLLDSTSEDASNIAGDSEAAALVLQTLVYDNPTNGKELLDSGAHDSLIRLLDMALKTGDLGAQANAASALFNLAQAQDDIKSELSVPEKEVVELVVDVLDGACAMQSPGRFAYGSGGGSNEDDASEAVEAAAGLISMLAENDEGASEAIGQTQAIPQFVQQLRSGNDGPRRASAWALRHLASVEDNALAMLKAGAIPFLVGLLQDSSTGGNNSSGSERGGTSSDITRTTTQEEDMDDAQAAAAGALQILALNDSCSDEIAKAGGIPWLIKCLIEGSDFCKTVAAGALGTLAYSAENRARIVGAGAIPPLVDLLDSENSEGIQESAAVALYNLAMNEEYRLKIHEAGAIKPLIHLLTSGSPDEETGVEEAASQALGCLAKSQACRAAVVEASGVAPLVQLLRTGQNSAQEEAARAVTNLALEPGSQAAALVAGGSVEALVELLKEEGDTDDYDAHRAACQALMALTPEPSSAEALLAIEDGVATLGKLLGPPAPVALRMHAAQALTGFASNQTVLDLMQDGGFSQPLLAMLLSSNDSSQLWAARALRHMAGQYSIGRQLVAGGAVAPLLAALQQRQGRNEGLVEAAVLLLGVLCETGEAGRHSAVIGPEGVAGVAGVLHNGNEAACRAAAKVLMELAADDEESIMSSDTLLALVEWTAANASARVSHGGDEAVRTLCTLAGKPQVQDRLLEAGVAAALIAFLAATGDPQTPEHTYDHLQVTAIDTIAGLARLPEGMRAVIIGGGAETLVAILGSQQDTAGLGRAALAALNVLASAGEAARGRVVVAGAVEPLRRMVSEGNAEEAALAASVLQSLQGDRESLEVDPGFNYDSADDVPGSTQHNLNPADSPGVVEEPYEDS